MRSGVFFLLLSAVLLSHPLDSILRETPDYETLLSTDTAYGQLYALDVKGMNWQGLEWRHRVGILIPKKIDIENVALVILAGGSRSKKPLKGIMSDLDDVAWISEILRVPIVVIKDIPNQPIWGLKEDALIAETFKRFLENPSPTLPALVPMTFGAIRSLDAVQDFLKKKGMDIENFMVGGASKRGWTTYLTAVFDPRVFAIFPMVYDNLNIPKQMKHQMKVYGKYSDKLKDYVERGLMKLLKSEKARKLLKLVDPYEFRLRLNLPKIIVLATNDEYWTVNSANLYLDDLPGETWIFYVPNAHHNFEKNVIAVFQLTSTIRAFLKLYPEGKFPKPNFEEREGKICVSGENLVGIEVWYSESEDLDFRDEFWKVIKGEKEAGKFCALVPKSSRNLAYFPRALYEYEGRKFYLSGRMRLSYNRSR